MALSALARRAPALEGVANVQAGRVIPHAAAVMAAHVNCVGMGRGGWPGAAAAAAAPQAGSLPHLQAGRQRIALVTILAHDELCSVEMRVHW